MPARGVCQFCQMSRERIIAPAASVGYVWERIVLGFVDLHNHALPGVDDGAPDAEVSTKMLSALSQLGFTTVALTPHQKAGQFLPSRAAITAARADLDAAVAAQGLEIELSLAAENMWDDVFFERMEADSIPSYDEGPAFLVEIPVAELPVGFHEHLFRLRLRGKLPVLAHPERYEPLWRRPEQAETLAESAALVVDLGAVAGYHGRRATKVARSLLERGVAHAAASDAHSPDDVRHAAAGMAWIRKKLGERALSRVLAEAPRRILAGEHPAD